MQSSIWSLNNLHDSDVKIPVGCSWDKEIESSIFWKFANSKKIGPSLGIWLKLRNWIKIKQIGQQIYNFAEI